MTWYVGRKGSVDNLSVQKAKLSDDSFTLERASIFVVGSAFKREGSNMPMKRDRKELGYHRNTEKLNQVAVYVVCVSDAVGQSRLLFSEPFALTGRRGQAQEANQQEGLDLSLVPPEKHELETSADHEKSAMAPHLEDELTFTGDLLKRLYNCELSLEEAEQEAWNAALEFVRRRMETKAKLPQKRSSIGGGGSNSSP